MANKMHLHKDEDSIYCDAPKAVVWNAVSYVSNSTCDLCIKGFINHSLTKMANGQKKEDKPNGSTKT